MSVTENRMLKNIYWLKTEEIAGTWRNYVINNFIILQPPAHAGSSFADFFILKMEATCSSETSVHTRSTRRHIPEDGILHSHRRENLKSNTVEVEWRLSERELLGMAYDHVQLQALVLVVLNLRDTYGEECIIGNNRFDLQQTGERLPTLFFKKACLKFIIFQLQQVTVGSSE
jgi:hypothetical protein